MPETGKTPAACHGVPCWLEISVWQTPEKIRVAAVTSEYAQILTAYDGVRELHIMRRNSLVESAACCEHRLIRSVLTS